MRIPGWCTECRRVKTVAASGHALAMAHGGVVQGVCADCERDKAVARAAEIATRGMVGERVRVERHSRSAVTGVLRAVQGSTLVVMDEQPPSRRWTHVDYAGVRHVELLPPKTG